MIIFKDVWLFRGDKTVLRNVNFTIRNDEKVAVLGASGEGKTTILRLILGLSRPDRGRIVINGEDITGMGEEELDRVRHGFSIVFQDGALFDSMTVGDNVAFYLREHTVLNEDEIDMRVRELLRKVGLEGEMHTFPTELSGGLPFAMRGRFFTMSRPPVSTPSMPPEYATLSFNWPMTGRSSSW